ncbi:methylated-DNA--[protein]-cysteine S-methyltransferase [Labrys sp. La1]|uniref:methylated-DNA--[protein]-cysteine S-methyltransferase n=1 Tax=Labrys sp. La1 TaxID=3404917 RepID=UPI003EB77F1B
MHAWSEDGDWAEAGSKRQQEVREALIRAVEETPPQLKGRDLLKADWIDTPIGAMLAVGDRHALHLIEFFDRKALPGELARLRKAARSAIAFGRSAAIDKIEVELADYFAGCSPVFATPLALHGLDFTRQVWQGLRQIPAGICLSYAALAGRLERPSAFRAVARANGANPFAIVVPCHRLVGSDGALTGYGGGIWRKRWLIEHERRWN